MNGRKTGKGEKLRKREGGIEKQRMRDMTWDYVHQLLYDLI